jgi:hypothetical protein
MTGVEVFVMIQPFKRSAQFKPTESRYDRTIRPPDAIQLACAAQAEVDLFIANDDRLSTKSVSRIHFITSLARAFL